MWKLKRENKFLQEVGSSNPSLPRQQNLVEKIFRAEELCLHRSERKVGALRNFFVRQFIEEAELNELPVFRVDLFNHIAENFAALLLHEPLFRIRMTALNVDGVLLTLFILDGIMN